MPPTLVALLAMTLAAVASAAAVVKLTIDGKGVTVKVPDHAAPGKPWLWVGEFAGHLESLEDGLVEQGWHVVSVGVSNQFGSAHAMETWKKAHESLISPKTVAVVPLTGPSFRRPAEASGKPGGGAGARGQRW